MTEIKYEGLVTLWKIQIDGRGGDSVHDEYFLERKNAVLAGAIDGSDGTPEPVQAIRLSGTPAGFAYILPTHIVLSPAPSPESVRRLRLTLTPGQRIALGLGEKPEI